MKTIIIGRGNLSNALQKALGSTQTLLLSSADVVKTPQLLIDFIKNEHLCNIILNCFQKSSQLFTVSSEQIVSHSLGNLAIILDIIVNHSKQINKIIYSSSSSVYGANSSDNCIETTSASPISMHGALKLASELLVSFYCNKHQMDYTLTRIFNIFGGDDEFSMIYRLTEAFNKKKRITLVNQGQAIRDYIHVDDLAWAYKKCLTLKNVPILNMGTGQGISTALLMETLKNKGIFLDVDYAENFNEIRVSVANMQHTENHLGQHQYLSCLSYLEERIKSGCTIHSEPE